MSKKADYRKIAASYDRGRPLSEQNLDLWLGLVAAFAKVPQGARALDLGCGTGRFAIPMATRLHLRVTGADSSEDMLAKAREKDVGRDVTWDRQNAEALTYPDESFDLCFLSHLLHHVGSPGRIIAECHRVLRSPGSLILRYGAIEQICDDVEHTFFPETLPIDEERTPTTRRVEDWLEEAGFCDITSKEIMQQTYETAAAHLAAAKARSTSVLHMIPPGAFQEGIRRLAAYLDSNPSDPWLLFDKLTLTVCYKG